MTDLKLGTLLKTNEEYERDAVHIAIAPVIAGENLKAAEHVGFTDRERTAVGKTDKPIGVIDPFLTAAVKKGQKCYMFLYPNTITSLRHAWSHPQFGDMADSIQWLEDFANQEDVDSYQDLMDAADAFLKHGDYLCEGGRWEGSYVPDEFWFHYEVVTGDVVPEDKRGSFFSCSC